MREITEVHDEILFFDVGVSRVGILVAGRVDDLRDLELFERRVQAPVPVIDVVVLPAVRQRGVIGSEPGDSVDQSIERLAVVPLLAREAGDVVVRDLPLDPLQQTVPRLAISKPEMVMLHQGEDDCECKLHIATCDVLIPDVDQFDPLIADEIHGHLAVFSPVESHLRSLTVLSHLVGRALLGGYYFQKDDKRNTVREICTDVMNLGILQGRDSLVLNLGVHPTHQRFRATLRRARGRALNHLG